MTEPTDEAGERLVIPRGAGPPPTPTRDTRPRRSGLVAITAVALAIIGYLATTSTAAQLVWTEGVAPQSRLNAESVIATPTGFSILGGPDAAGGVVWSTSDGDRWLSRTLPRLASRIVFHRRGLFVVDRRQVSRIGPDGDDPTTVIDLPDVIRIGNGSKRSGLMATADGLVAQTVGGDLLWSPDGRTFELAVPAAVWGADSDVTPPIRDISEVAAERVRSVCRPRARRAPDVPPMVVTGPRIVAMIPEDDPSVIWPVCEPVLWESADGSTWTPRSAASRFPEGAYVYDMAWRDGRFVAVGGIGFDNAIAWTSLDGTTWERIDALAQTRGMDITQVEAGPLGWVVTADPRDGSSLAGWFSPDGVCWESLPEEIPAAGIAIGTEQVVFVESDPAQVWIGTPSDSLLALSNCL